MGAGTEYPWDVAARELFHSLDFRPSDAWLQDNSERMFWLNPPNVSDYLRDEVSLAGFSLNELARLIVLLTTDELLRSALIDSCLPRTRYQLDLNARRERFWVVKVETAFNSREVELKMDFSGALPNIDCSIPPFTYKNGDECGEQAAQT